MNIYTMKRAGDALLTLFDERLMKKAQGYSKLFASWAELAQKNGIAAAADHSRIKELDRGILLVEADHPGWIQIIQTRESRLLDDFRRRFSDLDITGISLMLSRGRKTAGNVEDKPEQPAVATDKLGKTAPLLKSAPEETGAAFPDLAEKAGYDSIKDEGFKESLMRLERIIVENERFT